MKRQYVCLDSEGNVIGLIETYTLEFASLKCGVMYGPGNSVLEVATGFVRTWEKETEPEGAFEDGDR